MTEQNDISRRADEIYTELRAESYDPERWVTMIEVAAERIAELESQLSTTTQELEMVKEQLARARRLPKEPPEGLLMSMAIRYDHGLGIPGYYDTLPIQLGMSHKTRLESTLRVMSQLYEEVSGYGFYSPDKEQEYLGLKSEALNSYKERSDE